MWGGYCPLPPSPQCLWSRDLDQGLHALDLLCIQGMSDCEFNPKNSEGGTEKGLFSFGPFFYRLFSAGCRFYRIQLYTVITLHTQLNTAHLYMAITRHRAALHLYNSIQHNLIRYNSTCHNSTRHNSTRPQLNTPQLYTATTRHATTLHDTTLHDHNSTHHNSTRPQLDTPPLYIDHMAVRLKLL